jgi:hypothetical protein
MGCLQPFDQFKNAPPWQASRIPLCLLSIILNVNYVLQFQNDKILSSLTVQRCKPYYNHESNSNYEKFLSEASMRSIELQTRPCWKHLTPTSVFVLASSGVISSFIYYDIGLYARSCIFQV